MIEIITTALHGPMWLSWLTTLLGTSVFAGLFIALGRGTRSFPVAIRWSARGAGFGILVLPLALWLYAQFFTGPLRALLLGFPGLILLLHFSPFQDAGSVSHAIVQNTAAGVSGALRSAFVLGAAFWATIYGLAGFLLGSLSARRRRRSAGV
jgi:hypothetical protein